MIDYQLFAYDIIKNIVDELSLEFFPSTSGNISLRIEDNIVACTPTSIKKNKLKSEMVSIVNLQNELLFGPKQTSEINLHLEIYKNFSKVKYVVHTHPFFVTIFACINKDIKIDILPEYYLKIRKIVYVDYFTPGTLKLADNVVSSIKRSYGYEDIVNGVVVMKNHGLVVFSDDVEKSIDLTFCVEQLAKINYFSLLLSKPKRIKKSLLKELDEKWYH